MGCVKAQTRTQLTLFEFLWINYLLERIFAEDYFLSRRIFSKIFALTSYFSKNICTKCGPIAGLMDPITRPMGPKAQPKGPIAALWAHYTCHQCPMLCATRAHDPGPQAVLWPVKGCVMAREQRLWAIMPAKWPVNHCLSFFIKS